MTQIRISDLLNNKEELLDDNDFLVVDNSQSGISYKINKQNLFRVENLDSSTVSDEAIPNKLIKTLDTGKLSNNLLNIDIHSHHTESFTAEINHLYTLDSSAGSFTVYLPDTVVDGDKIVFSDWAYQSDANPITLIPAASHTILKDSFLELDVAGFGISIVFSNNNWSLA